MSSQSDRRFIIRLVTDSDKDFVMSYTSKTWEWGDYIGYVWDKWINDKNGQFVAIDVNGKAVAICHMDVIEGGVAWLEGMRVHPDYRNKGFASILTSYCISIAKERGLSYAMLVTSSKNKPAQRVAEKLGFSVMARYTNFKDEVKEFAKEESKAHRATLHEFDLVWNYLSSSCNYSFNNGIIGSQSKKWAFTFINEKTLKEDIILGNVIIHGVRQLDGIAILGSTSDDDNLYVRFIDGVPDGLKEIVKALRLYRSESGLNGIEGFAPVTSLIINILKDEGFSVNEGRQLLVYALKFSS
ncbi:MAG: GNAT family N-acetyltransferase [Thermoprotei archaeon]